MNRTAHWLLLIAFLIAVGLFPAALAPVTLAVAGAAAVLATVPGPVWVAVGVIAWLKHKPATTTA
ncbi:hypothetical protein [Streptomyces prasinopilosus]|uniref:hypothetical protein n=1 Tax=Streptomyces prasinopilosus TaxID=67344 RepID=UPI0006EBBAD1|nr:hypothetical protein [Streptomyces prasinopilosus]